MMNNWPDDPGPKLSKVKFADNLAKAAGNQASGFNPNVDG